LSRLRRPCYLFSSLTRCGECGAGFITLACNRLGCFGASAQGPCTNQLTIRRDEVEQWVLKALRENLLRKDLFEEFCREFTKEMNRLLMVHRAGLVAAERETQRLEARRASSRYCCSMASGSGPAARGSSATRLAADSGRSTSACRRRAAAARAPARTRGGVRLARERRGARG
jgi:hypothetical protein